MWRYVELSRFVPESEIFLRVAETLCNQPTKLSITISISSHYGTKRRLVYQFMFFSLFLLILNSQEYIQCLLLLYCKINVYDHDYLINQYIYNYMYLVIKLIIKHLFLIW